MEGERLVVIVFVSPPVDKGLKEEGREGGRERGTQQLIWVA